MKLFNLLLIQKALRTQNYKTLPYTKHQTNFKSHFILYVTGHHYIITIAIDDGVSDHNSIKCTSQQHVD